MRAEAPYRHAFTYAVPEDLALVPGQGVLVPFGPRTLQGVVLRLGSTSSFGGEVRQVLGVAPELPVLLPHQVQLSLWLAERYLAPLFACVALMLPVGVARHARYGLVTVDGADAPDDAQREILRAVQEHPLATPQQLEKLLGRPHVQREIAQLLRRGALRREYSLTAATLSPRQKRIVRLSETAATTESPLLERLRATGGELSRSDFARLRGWSEAAEEELIAAGFIEVVDIVMPRDPLAGWEAGRREAPNLTPEQRAAVEQILRGGTNDSGRARSRVTLLHGVTGSGKTEVYLAAAEDVIARGQRVLLLVPEISLTPQLIERVAGRFPGRVAVLHSGLSPGQRFDQWRAVREGRYDLVVGSRSAIFAPVASLGLIVLDEEHEWTYKQQDQQPRYDARAVAERLAALTSASVVLGSATPDVVSYQRARNGRYQLVQLDKRVRPAETASGWNLGMLAAVEVVDLGGELRENNRGIFSRRLAAALEETLAAGEQAILFLNRRGAASFVLCRDCGHVPHCRRCAISLTYHSTTQRLICHQCNRSRRAPARCPRCRGSRIRYLGLGAQRIEEEVRQRFPQARVLRWDRDAARRAEDHLRIFEQLKRGEADVLVGTQMVAKSLDLAQVTLVGIVNADISLNLPDYRSSERAFQILTQVSGRAGRGERPGRVILQTYAPNNYVIQSAAAHDYAAFFAKELSHRREGAYPPFARLTRLVYAHSSERVAEREARQLGLELRRLIRERTLLGSGVVGPVPCLVAQLRGRWRWQLLLRCPDPAALLHDLALPAGWSIDVDPQTFS